MLKRKFRIDFDDARDHSLEYLVGVLEDARVTTLQRVEKMTAAELHWQYRPGWNTIGALLAHIAAIEHYFRIEYVEGRPLTAAENERWIAALDLGEHLPRLIGDRPAASYVDELTDSRRRLLDSLRAVSFEDFARRREGYDAETGTNLAWVLHHMVEDEIYHRGQISLLQKLYRLDEGKESAA